MQIVSGKFKNRKLISPKGNVTRPTSSRLRESLFNICQGYVEDASFLDLFAGSGAMGFEALSRGAKHVTFVDLAKEALTAIEANAKSLDVLRDVDILFGDVFAQLIKLEKRKKQFDLIYADPPYDTPFSGQVLKIIDEGNLLKPGGELFIEDSRDSIPLESQLKTLVLKSSRRLGRSFLQQYSKERIDQALD